MQHREGQGRARRATLLLLLLLLPRIPRSYRGVVSFQGVVQCCVAAAVTSVQGGARLDQGQRQLMGEAVPGGC